MLTSASVLSVERWMVLTGRQHYGPRTSKISNSGTPLPERMTDGVKDLVYSRPSAFLNLKSNPLQQCPPGLLVFFDKIG